MNRLIILLILSVTCLADFESFNFNLYQQIISNNEEKNLIFSSFSLEVALAMVSEGCKGDSASEIFNVCSLPSDTQTRHQEIQQALAIINSNHSNFELKTANAIWPSNSDDFVLEPNFEDVIKTVYSGMVQALDFTNAPGEATTIINNWVAEETNNKILNLLPQGAITDLTRLVITNCLYFKALWEYQFNPYNTFQTDFYLDNSETVSVQMMNSLSEMQFKYYENNYMQMIRMPYKGDKISMLVLLPKENMTSLEQVLNEQSFQSWKDELELANVDLYLPKFKTSLSQSFKGFLQNMGITTIFGQNADFSGIDGNHDLAVTKIIQKAIIELNEFGTEAAASTAIVFDTTSFPDNIKTFKANKPFIFVILEEDTENTLFMGKLVNPGQEDSPLQMNLNNLDKKREIKFLD